MRALALLAVALAACQAPIDGSSIPGVSLTCSYAPAHWLDVTDRGENLCYRFEATTDAARVTIQGGDSCPDENATCAIAAPGERLLLWGDQLSSEPLLYNQGSVYCDSTCDDPWPDWSEENL